MLAGANRALADAAAPLRCAPADLAASVTRLAEEATARRKELERLLGLVAGSEAERLLASAAPGPVRATVTVPTSGAPAYARAVAAALAARGRVALIGAVEEGRAYLAFARPKGPGPHLGEALRAASATLGGKGGGAPESATGSGPDAARLDAALEQAARDVGR
jgi:alanyl-tRNA synthetase